MSGPAARAADPSESLEGSSAQLRAPRRREAAPALRLPDLAGVERGLSDHPDEVVLLHFWASWCTPCRAELPELQATAQRLAGQGLVVLTVAADSHAAVERFVAQQGLELPVLIDQYGSALRAYRVAALPATYVVGRGGWIERTAAGRVDWASPAVSGELAELMAR